MATGISVRIVFVAAFALLWPTAGFAVDWARVQGKDVTLFYPAQLSWEYLWDSASHSGAKGLKDGRACRGCHDGKEESSGALIVDYAPTEPKPIANKPGSIKANVKAAYDSQRLYVRISFNTADQPNADMDRVFSDKVAVMIDDGSVVDAQRAGCWVACHDDSYTMKNGETPSVTKHLGAQNVPGQFLEYWQARLDAKGTKKGVVGIIGEKRTESENGLVVTDAALNNGMWTVTFARDLVAGEGRKAFTPDKLYTLGLSIHAGHTARRFHYVSLEKTLMLDGGTADFIAVRQ